MPTEFKPAGYDVELMASDVLRKHERFHPILENGVRIEYLLAYSDGDTPALKHHGAAALAIIKVVTPEERATGGPDLRLKIDAVRFEKRNTRARLAILAHEFSHVAFVRKDGKTRLDAYNRPRIKLIPDDWSFTGFIWVAEAYGSDSSERRSFSALREILGQNSFSFMEQQDDLAAVKNEQGPPLENPESLELWGELLEKQGPPLENPESLELWGELLEKQGPPPENPGAELWGELFEKMFEETLSDDGDDLADEPLLETTPPPAVIKFTAEDREACQNAEDEGLKELKPKRTCKAAAAVEESDEDLAIFAIHSHKGVLKGFCNAPTLKAARAYQKATFPGCMVELDENGLVMRSPGYSVPDVDASGKLVGVIAAKPERERPAAKTKPRTKPEARP